MPAKKAEAAIPKTLPIRKKRKPGARVKKPKQAEGRSFLQRREDVFRAAGFSKKNIASFMQEEGARLLAAGEKRKRKAAAESATPP